MTGRLLTARAVAEMLDVTPATYCAGPATALPAVKLPSGQIRYRADELDEWLTERALGRKCDTQPKRGRPMVSLAGVAQHEE